MDEDQDNEDTFEDLPGMSGPDHQPDLEEDAYGQDHEHNAALLEDVISNQDNRPDPRDFEDIQSGPNRPSDVEIFSKVNSRLNGIPLNYELRDEGLDGGLYYIYPIEDDKPAKPPVKLCGYLWAEAFGRNPDDDEWSLVLRFRSKDGKDHRELIPETIIKQPPQVCRQFLAKCGLYLSSYPEAVKLLHKYLHEVKPLARLCTVDTIGWHNDVFVLPQQVVGNIEGEVLQFIGPNSSKHNYRQRGTLADWQGNNSKYCIGNSRLGFAVSCAFAGPLLSWIMPGGVGFNLRGPTSMGKTTVLRIAGSVYGGGGPLGFLDTWRSTDNGVEILAAQHNHGLLLMDEMGASEPHTVGHAAYMLATGQGKHRMTKDLGSARQLEWQLVMLSSSEVSLADYAAEAGKKIRGGQMVRIIDVPIDAEADYGAFEDTHGFKSSAEFVDQLVAVSNQYYGTALVAFLGAVITRKQDILRVMPRMISKLVQSLLAKTGNVSNIKGKTAGEVARVAGYFAFVGAAGEIATRLGITKWEEGEATKAIESCYQAWLKGRGTVGSADDEAIVHQVRLYIQRYGNSRFFWPATGEPRIPDQAGYKLMKNGEIEYVCFTEVFKQEICKGYDIGTAAIALANRGYLIIDKKAVEKIGSKKGRHIYRVPRTIPNVAGSGHRYYVLRGSILEEDNNGSKLL
jgi:putative DNA primase/helicase